MGHARSAGGTRLVSGASQAADATEGAYFLGRALQSTPDYAVEITAGRPQKSPALTITSSAVDVASILNGGGNVLFTMRDAASAQAIGELIGTKSGEAREAKVKDHVCSVKSISSPPCSRRSRMHDIPTSAASGSGNTGCFRKNWQPRETCWHGLIPVTGVGGFRRWKGNAPCSNHHLAACGQPARADDEVSPVAPWIALPSDG